VILIVFWISGITKLGYGQMKYKDFNLAIVQMEVQGGNRALNLERAGERIREAAQHGAQFILLPEAMDLGWTDPSALKQAQPVPGGETYNFLSEMARKYKLPEAIWNPYSMMALNQTLLVVRAIEHAAKKVGGDKLTGRAVYEAMFAGPFTQTELMDTLPTLTFTKEAPFPLGEGVKVMIETVKDGKYTVATKEWIPIPLDLEKW